MGTKLFCFSIEVETNWTTFNRKWVSLPPWAAFCANVSSAPWRRWAGSLRPRPGPLAGAEHPDLWAGRGREQNAPAGLEAGSSPSPLSPRLREAGPCRRARVQVGEAWGTAPLAHLRDGPPAARSACHATYHLGFSLTHVMSNTRGSRRAGDLLTPRHRVGS